MGGGRKKKYNQIAIGQYYLFEGTNRLNNITPQNSHASITAQMHCKAKILSEINQENLKLNRSSFKHQTNNCCQIISVEENDHLDLNYEKRTLLTAWSPLALDDKDYYRWIQQREQIV